MPLRGIYMGKYDEIINLPHHVSAIHPQMSMHDRAAQFSAFAALRGYDEAIIETGRITDKWVELDEYEKYMLDNKLQLIKKHISEQPKITITYFELDSLKDGGAYITITGIIRKINTSEKFIVMADGSIINIEYISQIEGELINSIDID